VNVLKVIPMVIRWIPHVITAISLVEVLAGDKPGAEKKTAVMAWLEGTSKKLKLPWGESVIAVVGNLVDAAVGIANLVGFFKDPPEVASMPKLDVSELDLSNPIDKMVAERLERGL
jgi:hypothetical protein